MRQYRIKWENYRGEVFCEVFTGYSKTDAISKVIAKEIYWIKELSTEEI